MAFRERYGARRNSQTRPVRAVITVVCDDTTTAVSYFELLRREFKDTKAIRVFPAPCSGATGDEVVRNAIAKRPDPVEADDKTFALLDIDTNPNQQPLATAGKEGGVRVLFSSPCFEVWTLAHLIDTGEMFIDCNAVLQRIKTRWKAVFGQDFGLKSQADYSKIMPQRQAAIDRCRKRTAVNSQSWSEVWEAVEAIVGEDGQTGSRKSGIQD